LSGSPVIAKLFGCLYQYNFRCRSPVQYPYANEVLTARYDIVFRIKIGRRPGLGQVKIARTCPVKVHVMFPYRLGIVRRNNNARSGPNRLNNTVPFNVRSNGPIALSQRYRTPVFTHYGRVAVAAHGIFAGSLPKVHAVNVLAARLVNDDKRSHSGSVFRRYYRRA